MKPQPRSPAPTSSLGKLLWITLAATALSAPAMAQGFNGRMSSPYSRPLPPAATADPRETSQYYYDPSDSSRYQPRASVDRAPAQAPVAAIAPSAFPQAAPQAGARRVPLPPDADPNYSSLYNYDSEIDGRSTRRMVSDPTNSEAGAITIQTKTRTLYLSLGNGQAWEYGIGVGRQGFSWKGTAMIGRKAVWPGWTPPPEMVARRPDLPVHMDGGMSNPLGARALYLFQNNKDTLFRIHGTNEPDTIGHAVSSGCIRMLNADVLDLYTRIPVGTRVSVM